MTISDLAEPTSDSKTIAKNLETLECFRRKKTIEILAVYPGIRKVNSRARSWQAISEPLQSKIKGAKRATKLLQKLRVCFCCEYL